MIGYVDDDDYIEHITIEQMSKGAMAQRPDQMYM